METVRQWADANSYDYEFIDDRLFTYLPDWYRKASGAQLLPQTDLARLAVAKELLAGPYDRAVWVDADIVIYDPDGFKIDTPVGFSLCHEVWTRRMKDGSVRARTKVNNAVLVFHKNNSFLDFYIFACQSIMHSRDGNIHHDDVGTRFLSSLNATCRLPLLATVGMFSPDMCRAMLDDDEPFLDRYAELCHGPCYAANLCASLTDANPQRREGNVSDADMLRLVDKLIDTKGARLNGLIAKARDGDGT